MVCGIGVDLIEVERIGRARRRWGGRFLERVFTEAELSVCIGSAVCDRRLAARFAAKEATLKALGTGLAKGARWREIEVRNGERGAPVLRLSGTAADRARAVGANRTFLSLSHIASAAVAFVVLEND